MRNLKDLTAALLVLVVIVIGNVVIAAQQADGPPDMAIDEATKGEVINNILENLNRKYVFPDVAVKIESHIRGLIAKGEYDKITSARKFAEKLTQDLEAVNGDKHLRVGYSHPLLPERNQPTEPTAEEKAREQDFMRRVNYGFESVKRLEGNIGYIEFRGFFDPEGGADTVAAAMGFVANTDSLIFDLRRNGGGDPAMVALICSYLFGNDKVHLNDLYWREGNKTEEYWTSPDKVRGPHYVGKDVYVLTSNRTFSGAEEFSYNLKNLKRATIVGETTGGGAHPGEGVRLSDHFRAFIPTGRAISPITKTNWEGKGVTPDVAVSKDIALETAYKMALTKTLSKTTDEDLKNALKGIIDRTEKEIAEKSKQ